MRDHNLNFFPGDEEPPVPIPPADEGWNKLLLRLDQALPVTSAPVPEVPPKPVVKPLGFISGQLKLFIAGIAAAGTLCYITYHLSVVRPGTRVPGGASRHTGHQPPAQKTTPATSILPGQPGQGMPAATANNQQLLLPDDTLAERRNTQPVISGTRDTMTATGNKQIASSTPANNLPVTLFTAHDSINGTRKKQSTAVMANGTNADSTHTLSTATRNNVAANGKKQPPAHPVKSTPGTKTGTAAHHAMLPFKAATGNTNEQHPLSDNGQQHNAQDNTPALFNGAKDSIRRHEDQYSAVNSYGRAEKTTLFRLDDHNGKPMAIKIHPPREPFVPLTATAGKNHRNGLQWQVQLQWQAPLPLQNGKYYFAGPDGNTQLYRNFLPGLRTGGNWKKSGITLDLQPFAMQTVNPERLSETIKTDTFRQVKKTMMATKKFGYSAVIQYHRQLTDNWHVAAGAGISYWQSATAIQRTTQIPGNPPGPVTVHDSAVTRQNIKQLNYQVTGEVYYDARRWQSGIRISVPVNSNKDSSGITTKPPMQVELLFRIKLWRNK